MPEASPSSAATRDTSCELMDVEYLTMPTFEVTPKLTRLEKIRLDCLSSLNFNEFHVVGLAQHNPRSANITEHPERHILFKGFRVLERRLEMLLSKEPEDKRELSRIFLKLGHINLLAHDFARALSAYQQSLKLGEDLFWRDQGANYGIGLVYLHFKNYRNAIEAFNRVLYTNPWFFSIASEVHTRLGVAYKAIKEFDLAIRHLRAALHDTRESVFLSKNHIRLNIAYCHEAAGNLDKAYEECRALLEGPPQNPPSVQLQAAILRALGWLCYRAETSDPEERARKLLEAETYLAQSKALEQGCGKTFYYLGRCFGDTQARAHEAFVHYRFSIDKSEADADTWCSIGVLYQQQQQPMDALQAFVCAVDLDAEHCSAWTNLGQLYESHSQFVDAIQCLKNSLRYNPIAPEVLKARISVLERELALSPVLLSPPPTPAGGGKGAAASSAQPQPHPRLPSLKDAWQQPIPSELRGRQDDFLRQKQQRYRDGSPLWRMGDLATVISFQSYEESRPLDAVQVNMMRLLKVVEPSGLDPSERAVLAQLEHRFNTWGALENDVPLCRQSASSLPSFSANNEPVFTSLFDLDDEKPSGNIKKEEPDDEASRVASGSEGQAEAAPPQPAALSATPSELPQCFSLQAPLRVPLDVSACELLEQCAKRVEKPAEFREIFDEKMPPPTPPQPPPPPPVKEGLLRPTPLVIVESRKDAQSIELQRFCENQPIALIRGLTAQLRMDLSLFSTKTLLEVAPDHEVEVRTQYRMPGDVNVDHLGQPTWECRSVRSFTTVTKYASYQADTFRHSLKEEAEKLRGMGAKYGSAASGSTETSSAKKRKVENGESVMPIKQLKFGTNVDLSDDVKFKAQLTELAKMPPFCRLIAGCNLLSHLGHTVLGMNSVQLYMKVPGSRTPGHQENNNLASVNINIGPGDCEWFGVPYEYWGVMAQACRERGIDFLKGAWWPNIEDLNKLGIPVFRMTQKAGDLVWVGAGCIHWVQSTGWCNNVAWNVGPITPLQLQIAVHSYEWNKLQGYKSLVPMQHLFWQLAKNVKPTNQKLYSLIRANLIRSMAHCKMVCDFAESRGKQIKSHPRAKGEITHYCSVCQVEVFNILFVKECHGKFSVSCVNCARRAHLQDYHVLQQISFQELSATFDSYQLHSFPKVPLVA